MDSYSTQLEYSTSRNESTVKEENWWQFVRKETKKEEIKTESAVNVVNERKQQESRKEMATDVKGGISSLICNVDPMTVAEHSVQEKCEDELQKAASPCPHCQQFFPTHFHFLEHVSICRVPPIDEAYKSTCCSFNCGGTTTNHKFNKFDRELYVKQCIHELCGPSLKINEDLKPLKSIHGHEIPNSCGMCSAALRMSVNLQKEKAMQGSDKTYLCEKYEKDMKYLNNISDQNDRPYKCEICSATFKQWAGLKNHKHVHSDEKPHVCSMCGTGFKQSSALEIHKRIHTNEKPYSCDVCDAAFKQSSHLKQHKRIHTNETPYSCDVCKAAFKQSVHLKQHKRIHTNEKPYICDVCNGAFRQSEHLRQHKRIHTNETPYSCDMCCAAFKQSVHLKQHKRIHTNEKPYSCDICSAAFRQSEHLKLHKRTHTNEKPYSCDICSAAFRQSAHLKQHKRIHFQYKP